MSLGDFLGDGPSTASWADEELALPTAPMSVVEPSTRTTLANALDRKEMMAHRRAEQAQTIEYPTEPPFTAYVSNLPFDVTEDQLQEMFAPVEHIRLIRDRETDRLKGFGYVDFSDVEGLKRAVQMDGKELGGRPLRIGVSERREERGGQNWRRDDGMGSRNSSGFGRPREPREPTAAEAADDWRAHKSPAAATERMPRSSSGFGRSSSGFGRPREPREPTAAESAGDWRMHKSPEESAASGEQQQRRSGRFSRTSSGDGEGERVWRSPRTERTGSREPRAPRVQTAADQASSWRTPRAAGEPSKEWNRVDRAPRDAKPSGEPRGSRAKQQSAAEETGNWRRQA
ncbi:Eukaryotic translation initiation factor 4B [Coemansia brasiliensis]|uniref:Eukaryotic translation initiation factor 4B n=1 Tax=Coemansia brasiliensis TaxID=2650707 RepID=A0A9W8I254_9FUNG|nr:Eukaryotic translation initiation factor 4B [Coemansia brasiliensis]